MRLERLQAMLDNHLAHPAAALEALMAGIKNGDAQESHWEGLHAAALRDGKEQELAKAYQQVAQNWRMKQLDPPEQALVLMHAADFFQGVAGDPEASQSFLERVMEVAPDHKEAFSRLEQKYGDAKDRLRLTELYACFAAARSDPDPSSVTRALNAISPLPASFVLSEEVCRRLLHIVPAHPRVLDVLQAHCKKTERPALACELLEEALDAGQLSDKRIVELRQALVELYIGDAKTPEKAIDHVEDLLKQEPGNALMRSAAERLMGTRSVASRAAAALKTARTWNR